MSNFLRLLVLFVHQIEELFNRQVVDREKFAKTLNRDVRLAFFDSPVLHARQLEVVSKIFVTGVSFFLPEICKLCADARQGIV